MITCGGTVNECPRRRLSDVEFQESDENWVSECVMKGAIGFDFVDLSDGKVAPKNVLRGATVPDGGWMTSKESTTTTIGCQEEWWRRKFTRNYLHLEMSVGVTCSQSSKLLVHFPLTYSSELDLVGVLEVLQIWPGK